MKKKWWMRIDVLVGILTLGLVVILIILKVTNRPSTVLDNNGSKTITSGLKGASTPPFKLQKPGELAWETKIIEGLGKGMDSCQYSLTDIDKLTDNMVKVLGLTEKKSVGKFNWYSDKTGWITIYSDKTDKTIKYQKDLIALKPTETIKQNKVSETELREKMIDLWKEIAPNGPQIETSNIYYESVNGVRFVTEKESEAEIVEIEGVWYKNDRQIISQMGAPVVARFKRDGELIYFKIILPYDINSEKCEQVLVIDSQEITTLAPSRFSIIKTTGSKEFDESGQEELIAKMTITKALVVYLWDPYETKLSPQVKIEGNAILSTGPVVVTAIANIVK